jgi:hypothetical protein
MGLLSAKDDMIMRVSVACDLSSKRLLQLVFALDCIPAFLLYQDESAACNDCIRV